MRLLGKRVKTLEERSGLASGLDYSKPFHRIIFDEGQSHAEALAAYRAALPDVAVEPDHNVIWIEVVSPQFDEAGNLIPKEKGSNRGPSLADVLEGRVK